jgi:hypothetical protein
VDLILSFAIGMIDSIDENTNSQPRKSTSTRLAGTAESRYNLSNGPKLGTKG